MTIDGEAYWDGGYSGNPALWPLIYGTAEADLLLVKTQPLERAATPQTALAIADRASEIGFNAVLVAEMRAIAFVKRLLAEQRVERGRYKDLRLHLVTDEDGLGALDAASKLDTSWDFLESLWRMGRAAAERWLDQHRAAVGLRSSYDIEAGFLTERPAGARARKSLSCAQGSMRRCLFEYSGSCGCSRRRAAASRRLPETIQMARIAPTTHSRPRKRVPMACSVTASRP